MKSKDKKDNTSNSSDQINLIQNRFLRVLVIIAGTIFLGLGIFGIFLPILPTTPFLLLAAACYSKSSKRFYFWMINNKLFGKYIKDYRDGKGIPLKTKIIAISFLWITILISALLFIHIFFIRLILIFIAIFVSIHLLRI